jgi:putative transposase
MITRGNGRRDIFHSREDHDKFIQMLMVQKQRLPFYLYAYCLMTNHIHLLIERRTDDIGRIMHRLLTGYTQYYNRRYKKIGHVLQGRYKAVLCQSETYLTTLVRYIHLNPVRAKMVSQAVEYPFSSHRAYLGLDPAGPLDVDPVLRHFGSKKAVARRHFSAFVDGVHDSDRSDDIAAMLDQGSVGILGSDEFVDATIHRLGEHVPKGTPKRMPDLDTEALLASVEEIFGVGRKEICGSIKSARIVEAKEALIVCGRRVGASVADMARLTGLNSSTVSRRYASAISKIDRDKTLQSRSDELIEAYHTRIAILQD